MNNNLFKGLFLVVAVGGFIALMQGCATGTPTTDDGMNPPPMLNTVDDAASALCLFQEACPELTDPPHFDTFEECVNTMTNAFEDRVYSYQQVYGGPCAQYYLDYVVCVSELAVDQACQVDNPCPDELNLYKVHCGIAE